MDIKLSIKEKRSQSRSQKYAVDLSPPSQISRKSDVSSTLVNLKRQLSKPINKETDTRNNTLRTVNTTGNTVSRVPNINVANVVSKGME